MARRQLRKLIWWMLPLLALRGLVPVGFMVDASHGELAIVVCPGHIVVAQDGNSPAAEPYFAEPHSQDAAGSASQHVQPTQKPCPFTVASGPAPLAGFVSSLAQAQPIDVHAVVESYGPIVSQGPLRAQSSRAPPFFS